jgi:DNA (cytosine-5)-methyltransferase 1
MVPSSPCSAAPVRASVQKRAAKAVAEEIQDQEVMASSNKRRRSGSSSSSTSSKKSKSPLKKAKATVKKAERKETLVDDEVYAEEPDEEEIALGEEDEVEEQERQVEEAAAVSLEKAGRKHVAQPHARRAGSGSDEHEPEFIGDPVPLVEVRAKWPERYNRGTAVRRYISSNLLFFLC